MLCLRSQRERDWPPCLGEAQDGWIRIHWISRRKLRRNTVSPAVNGRLAQDISSYCVGICWNVFLHLFFFSNEFMHNVIRIFILTIIKYIIMEFGLGSGRNIIKGIFSKEIGIQFRGWERSLEVETWNLKLLRYYYIIASFTHRISFYGKISGLT